MRVRLLSPFRCHLHFQSASVLGNEVGYCALWEQAQSAFHADRARHPHVAEAEFLHAHYETTSMRYQKLHENGSLLSPEVLRLRPTPAAAELTREATARADEALADASLEGAITPLPETLLYRVYGNTMGLAEVEVEVPEAPFHRDGEQVCRAVQTWSNAFMNQIIPAHYRSLVFPVVYDAWRADAAGAYVETPGAYHGFADVTLVSPPDRRSAALPDYHPETAGRPLWVNRSLFLDDLEPKRLHDVVRHWVPPALFDGDVVEQLRSEVVFLGWGHNIFPVPAGSAVARDAWEALLLCQYFYTVLESTNLGLNRFIVLSLGNLSRKKTRDLGVLLQDVVSSVNLLVTQFNDTQQNLQGNRQVFLKTLKERWGMDTLVHNVDKKIAIITGQIHRLYERSVKWSQMYTQLLLFGIGGIGLVDFCLGLVSFVHSQTVHPSQGPASDGVAGLLDLAAAFPPDGVLWGGLGLLAVILATFLYFLRRGI